MPADPTPEDEVRRLERHYSVNPDGLVFARLADAYRRCGRLEQALALLNEGLESHPDYATGHLIHGRVLREDGRPEEAAEAYRRVLELDAENLVALRSLAELAAERGATEEARRWAKRVRRADPFATFTPDQDLGEGGPEGHAPAEGEPEDADSAEPAGVGPGDGGDDGPIPGEDALASEIAAVADDQWWDESEDSGGEEDAEVATETMARLYAEQGLYDEAAAVYRRLLERRPDEAGLRRRLEEMRRRAEDGEPDRESPAEGERAAGERETVPEEGATEGGESAGAAPEAAAEERDPPRGEVSAREHFRALLRGRARPGREEDREDRAGDAEAAGAVRAAGGRSR